MMKTWKIVTIVFSCVLAISAVVGITLLMIDRHSTDVTKEELLVSEVQGKYPEATNWPTNTIVNIAKDTCQALDQGATMSNTINAIAIKYPADAESDYDLIAFTMITGINDLCPQH